MSARQAHVSSLAGQFAHSGAAHGNAPSAPFWMHLALIGLRYVRKNIERAEERAPRSTGTAHDHVVKAIAELEDVFPSQHA